ncbi:phage portal protein [Microcella sp.]|uniref:phage portal protein n=1 Tax=Microcella sp. TaxID=1913979 RepID=UPI00391AE580
MVNRIYARLNNRRDEIIRFEDYYLGKQPLTFATKEWQAQNAARYDTFADNWTAPVVNAESERIQYTGLNMRQGSGVDAEMAKAASDMLHECWLRNELDMQSSQGWVTTLTARRSFVIVWADRVTQEPIVTWEHPSQVEIEYDFANPMRRVAALKTWLDEEWEYATLYTPEWVWKFQRGRTTVKDQMESQAEQARSERATDGGWIMREIAEESWPLANPLGVVPVVEVANRPPLKGDPISEIAGVVSMQDAINLLWAYLFLAADYASMPARVVLGAAPPMISILDGDGNLVGEKPVDMKELSERRLFYVDGDDPKIDSWEAARLDVFTDTIDVAVAHISSQTRTPPTYLVSKTGMSNVNSEGLKASEIGLNKKVTDFEVFASPALREVNRLIALVLDQPAIAEQVRLAKVSWMNPEIRSEAQLADSLLKKQQMGYPFEYLLELDGVGPLERARILELKQKQEEALFGFSVQQAVQDGMSGVDA